MRLNELEEAPELLQRLVPKSQKTTIAATPSVIDKSRLIAQLMKSETPEIGADDPKGHVEANDAHPGATPHVHLGSN